MASAASAAPRVQWSRPPGSAVLAWAVAVLALVVVAVAAVARVTDGAGEGVPAELRDWLLAPLCAPLGARIVAYAPRNACGWLVLAVGALAAATVGASMADTAPTEWLRLCLWWPGYGLLVLIGLLFPTGHAVSHRWRWLTVVVALSTAAGTAGLAALASRAPEMLDGDDAVAPGWDSVAFLCATAVLMVGGALAVVTQILRIRRAASRERGPLVWAATNVAILLAAFALDTAQGVPLVWVLGVLAIPATTAIGVLRYGLYDIDVLLHRSLQYGLLTGSVLAAYAAALMLDRAVMPYPLASAVAVVVLALLPARAYLQKRLRLNLYGLGSQPYELVEQISRRIGAALTPEQMLAAAVAAVGEGMLAPFVQVYVSGHTDPEAEFGIRRTWPVTRLPLEYHSRVIGELVIQQRSPDEPWSRREQRLLLGIAAQLGPSAASVRLTRELQAARARLVRAREDELRRLQRELHDGIGPALSGARMVAYGVRGRLTEPVVRQQLDDLDADLANAAAELRRIIDDLRPPALDRGLPAALRTAAQRHRTAQLSVELTLRGDLSVIPAAVEVAAYRIVDEALTNVVTHASARHARLDVTREAHELRIEVTDDGIGPGRPRPDGLGLDSMRQRCQELGGACTVEDALPGTRVRAHLPLI